jgi:hypothetical protein
MRCCWQIGWNFYAFCTVISRWVSVPHLEQRYPTVYSVVSGTGTSVRSVISTSQRGHCTLGARSMRRAKSCSIVMVQH